MAWPESLTIDQQTAVTDLANLGRSLSRLAIQLAIVSQQYNTIYGGGVGTFIGTLSGGDQIPNTSGFAGSQDATQADLGNLASWAALISNTANAPSQGSLAGALAQGTFLKLGGPVS